MSTESYTHGVGATRTGDAIAGAIAATLTPDDTDADSIAKSVMNAARSAGLDDNATVVVARVAAVGA